MSFESFVGNDFFSSGLERRDRNPIRALIYPTHRGFHGFAFKHHELATPAALDLHDAVDERAFQQELAAFWTPILAQPRCGHICSKI